MGSLVRLRDNPALPMAFLFAGLAISGAARLVPEPEVLPKRRPEVVCVVDENEAGIASRCWRVPS